MGCASGTIKCILYFLNILLLIGGVAILGFSIYYLKSLPTIYNVYWISSGALSLFIALFGCIGICKESVSMTKAYAILILISVITQLIGHFVIANIEAGKVQATDGVLKQWAKELQEPGAMDGLQILYECCGKDSSQDYINLGRTVPSSCYANLSNKPDNTPHRNGCIEMADQFINDTYESAAGGQWSNLAVTLFTFACACYLVVHFSNKQRRYNYN